MKLHQLKAFLRTLETGSFSEAALDLGLSQASVSYAVAELEKTLGVKLLERTPTGALPTELGQEVATHARVMFQAFEAIEQSVSLKQGALRGRLRLATFPSIASKLVPKLFAELQKRHPELELSLEVINDNDQLETSLREGKSDVALLLNRAAGDLFAWELMQDPFVVLVPEVFAVSGESVSPDELCAWPIILQQSGQSARQIGPYLHALCASVQSKSSINKGAPPVMNEGAIMMNLVAQGLGAALVASMLLEHVPQGVRVLPLEKPLERTLFTAILPSSLKVPAVRVCLGTLKRLYPNGEVPRLELPQAVVSQRT